MINFTKLLQFDINLGILIAKFFISFDFNSSIFHWMIFQLFGCAISLSLILCCFFYKLFRKFIITIKYFSG